MFRLRKIGGARKLKTVGPVVKWYNAAFALRRRESDSPQVHCFAKASQCTHFIAAGDGVHAPTSAREDLLKYPLCGYFICEAVSPPKPRRRRATTFMYYVYILRSERDDSYYVGTTTDIDKRLREHNSGFGRYSSTHRPFRLSWYCAFFSKEQAYDFEKYLKSGSGFAFRNKHLI